jgi:hypothetical protein
MSFIGLTSRPDGQEDASKYVFRLTCFVITWRITDCLITELVFLLEKPRAGSAGSQRMLHICGSTCVASAK